MFFLKKYKKHKTWLLITLFLVATSNSVFGQGPKAEDPYDVTRYVMILIGVILAFVIVVLANSVKVAAKIKLEKIKLDKASEAAKVILPFVLLLLSNTSLFAQADTAIQPTIKSASMPLDIYLFLSAIIVEFIVVLFLIRSLLSLLDIKVKKDAVIAKTPIVPLFQRINKTVPIEEEHTLDMQHNYDGIRELDNNVPGWWKVAFACTILFGFVYIYRMFGSETLPKQMQELTVANEMAAIQKEEYLKKAANNIDENNVKMVDANGVTTGKEIFIKNCVACHADKGQGSVGPNLTDEYWLHKGGIKDIFYSVKYGWQEKGMKSWKEDLSPLQIAQVASYVHSIRNTNVPGKEKQGELYVEDAVAIVIDSTIKK